MSGRYQLVYTEQAIKNIKKIHASKLEGKAKRLLKIIKEDPFASPSRYEKLIGDLEGAFSRRINIQHRLVYQVYEEEKVIKIIRLWTHYE